MKSAATYRFWAQVNNFSKAEDLAKERKRFTEENFSKEAEGGGLLLFPNTYTNINQVKTDPWVVDKDQMEIINKGVYEYFMVNEDILMNRAYGDKWTAFYEGAVEPFAIQFSEVMTRMLFTFVEQSRDNRVIATANRLQYMSTSAKVQMAKELGDRGAILIDEIRELFNYDPLPDGAGQVAPIRGEYKATDTLTEEGNPNAEEE